MLVWAVHNGGYNQDTWYWGALAMLFLLVISVFGLRGRGIHLSRPMIAALACFALYVCWSYLSILWAQDQGLAWDGSNRALLYLLTFTLLAILPWTTAGATAALLTFTLGVGVIATVLLTRLAAGSNVGVLFVSGRLAAPTGYINSTAALFTMAALTAIALSVRRELYGPIRGLLIAFAAADLDLAVTVESRGWLFTLPLVALIAVIVVRDRLRVAVAAALVGVACLIPIRGLLHLYINVPRADLLRERAIHGARPALLICLALFFAATLVAWADGLSERTLRRTVRRLIGTVLAVVAVAAVTIGLEVVAKGHPDRFISRQWNGFVHDTGTYTGSHFAQVGSGRFNFWQVALDAFRAHPVGGIGQDNFDDYYIVRGTTGEEPSWPHSLEMRLLAMTGAVGFLLFMAFLVLAVVAAARARRRGPPLGRALVGAALLPLTVWLIHGSIDWFWEMPALSGPALGFLAIAGSLRPEPEPAAAPNLARSSLPPAVRVIAIGVGGVALLGCVLTLIFPYLSVREVSIASDIQNSDPRAALADLRTASQLNPLDSDPARLAGAIALRAGEYTVARQRFEQAIQREPGSWFAWLGAGLAASELGDRVTARHDYQVARSIDRWQAAIRLALKRIDGPHPLTSVQAFKLLTLTQ
jgi:O-Antigen ligase